MIHNNLVDLPSNLYNSYVKTNVSNEKNTFYALLNIVDIAYQEYRNDDTANYLIQSIYHVDKGIQQNVVDFYNFLLNNLRLIAIEMNQTEIFSKLFEIKFTENTDGCESQIKREQFISINSHQSTIEEYINKYYTGTVVRYNNGHIIEQLFEQLPEQLFIIIERQHNDICTYCDYPAEFKTCRNQYYIFNSAIVKQTMFGNDNHCIAVVRRQDCIYLLDGPQIIDRSHINYLSTYFQMVQVQNLLYTEVDPLHGSICIFEDPLYGILAGETSSNISTDLISLSVESYATSRIIMRHPIASTFRYYMHSDFYRHNINITIPTLNDCLGEQTLYLWPRSMFVGALLECTLVSLASNGSYYRSHFEFVLNELSGLKFENSIYFNIDEGNSSDDQWFP
ncbi:hypothetical protein I4U23_028782 [Adineta vaga]|nr:hypothetical protein I4U23_028782 [Adineta vaga]